MSSQARNPLIQVDLVSRVWEVAQSPEELLNVGYMGQIISKLRLDGLAVNIGDALVVIVVHDPVHHHEERGQHWNADYKQRKCQEKEDPAQPM